MTANRPRFLVLTVDYEIFGNGSGDVRQHVMQPTGAVVGQQPFGGGRASGTNDKAGGIQNMLRWTSPRSIKETFAPPSDFRYPFMG